jgi:hypothetical protein
VRPGWARGRGHWLLARRSLTDPEEISYYACSGPRRSSTADLAWAAGSRWHVEECFQQAKGETGLDHHQVRTWRAWYTDVTLSMLALAWLAAARAQAAKRGAGTSDPGMIRYTLAEIRRLLATITLQQPPDPGNAWSWSRWRRKRQYQARISHYRRPGYAVT